jgi:cytidyltransferase-like protein
MSGAREVVISGVFDDIRSRDLRFLHEASKLGNLTVLLWSDDCALEFTGKTPKFPLAERVYFLEAIRFVNKVLIADSQCGRDELPDGVRADIWADCSPTTSSPRRTFCETQNIEYRRFRAKELGGFPEIAPAAPSHDRKKVIVTGCFDWLHSGHVRFFEEIAGYGDLYVVVGHDTNIRLLKGAGHPMQPQEERRYAVAAVKHVKQALISSGHGQLDAEPEIELLKPDLYAVNEDGDHASKREYCRANGIGYVVLRRAPADGLPRRSSTDLRGF